ncbi:MAG TPA: tetratricopeptide repeat protein [Polyangiaceae bacterium]
MKTTASALPSARTALAAAAFAFLVACGARPSAPPSAPRAEAGPCEDRGRDACEQACTAHDDDSCAALGESFLSEDGTPSGRAALLAALEPPCGRGNQRACVAIGRYLVNHGGDADRPRERKLFEAACDGGYADGCDALAEEYIDGRGVAADAARGVALFRRACDAKSLLGCQNLAEMLLIGDGVAPDRAAALALFEKGCAADFAASCWQLGQLYLGGLDGIADDQGKARHLFERACDGEFPLACARLGELLVREHLPGDVERGMKLLDKECERSNADACRALAQTYEPGGRQKPDPAKAIALYERACELGDSECSYLAELYAKGRLVTADAAKARALYERSCRAGVPDSCLEVTSPDARKFGYETAKKMCAAGDSETCKTMKRLGGSP